MLESMVDRVRLGAGAAGAALIIGAILPWAKVSGPLGISLEVAGTDSQNDGWATLACGVAIILFAVLVVPWRAIGISLAAAGAVVVGVVDFTDIRDRIDKAQDASPLVHASVGLGLWLTLFGGIVAFGLAIWLYRLDHATVTDDEPSAIEPSGL